jgi:hypothetical protein
MENGKQGAFACVDSQKQYLQEGLTKREYFAGLALQGICMEKYVQRDDDREIIAEWSVKMADALLAELEKTKEE